jgi:periodic tryptophan protein 1
MLPSFPLCIEWLNYNVNSNVEDDGSRRGNMVAVGTFDPDIEIWDLDTVETIYPNAVLGAASEPANLETNKKKKKKKKAKKVVNEKFHVDSIMCLSANRLQRNLLLSGSADTTVKLWDLSNGSSSSCTKSYSFHKDKISSVQWHPKESFYALSGSYDKNVIASDFRTVDGKGANWKFDADIEGVKWDPHDSNYFYVLYLDCSSNNRFHSTMEYFMTSIFECIQHPSRNRSGCSKLMTQEYQHSTYPL